MSFLSQMQMSVLSFLSQMSFLSQVFSSALFAPAASFHRLLLDRQAFRLAFTFFSHCLLRWFYFYLLNAFISASHQARRSGIRFPPCLGGCRSRCYRNRQAEKAIPLAVHKAGLDEVV